MSANNKQVGGTHYQTSGPGQEQHWDRMWRLHGRGYFIGQITRYVERYHLKNGLQDLEKAVHYIDKLRELELAWAAGTGPAPGSTGSAPLPTAKEPESADVVHPPVFIPAIAIGPDGLCDCTCATPCPIGKMGSQIRCNKDELTDAGIPVREHYQ